MSSKTSDTESTVTSSDLEEKQTGLDVEKLSASSIEAQQGHSATDQHGQPLVTFDAKAEARLRLKIDFYVLPTVALLYLFCFIDRANIGNARIAGLEADLHLHGFDYNAVLSMFYISYIIFEIPSNMACKYFGPGWFIPAISTLFGICSIATAYVNNKAQVSAVRFLLGVFEAGMLPGIAYYLSRWYRRSELALRLAAYIVMGPLAGAFGGLLASGILSLDHFAGLHRWRMIFAIEGIVTTALGVISFFTLTDRPASARWLTQEEKDLAIARVKSERVAATEVLDGFDMAKIIRGLTAPSTIATSAIFFLNNITVQGLAFFAPTVVRTIYPHNSVVSQQLHTVPPYVVGAVFALLFPFLASRYDTRLPFLICSAPLMIIGYIMFLASENLMVRYGASFLVAAGAFVFGSLCNATVSANIISDTARSSAIGMTVMMGNIGGLISTWSFLSTDAPNYHIGNGINFAASTLTLIVCVSLVWWMRRDNRRRDQLDVDRELAGLTVQQIQDLDWKHPSFRWKP